MISTRTTRRMLVALDPEDWPARDLETIARLAAGMKAEIEGLYVEDRSLIHAAGLSATRFVSSNLGTSQELDQRAMNRAMRARAAEARARLEAAAKRWTAAWHFNVAAGDVSEELVARTSSNDLIVMSISRQRQMNAQRQRATAVRVARQAACSVMLLNQRSRADRSLLAIYKGRSRVLEEAAELAEIYAAPLTVLVISATVEGKSVTEAQEWAEARSIEVTLRVASDDEQALAVIQMLRPGMVVSAQEGLPERADWVGEVLRNTSLLILR